MPLSKPVMVADVASPSVVVTLCSPGADVTVYAVIAEPPLLAGGVHDTEASPLPAVAVPIVGAPGAVSTAVGVVEFDAPEAGESPAAFIATTVKVYSVSLVRPVTVAVVAPVVSAVTPPGEEVTVYFVIAEPPLLVGAVHDTEASPLPAVAVTLVGAPGTVRGVTAFEASAASESPAVLVATTVNV